MTSPAPNPPPSALMAAPDWSYLVEHGLDRATLELRFPLGADWHTLRSCAHPACDRPAEKYPWLCWRCCAAWQKAGSPGDIASWCAAAPAPTPRRVYGEKRCSVGCPRPAEASGLCKSCAGARRATGLTVEEYLATGPAPRPGLGECVVRVCARWAMLKGTRLCPPHQRQWADAGRPDLPRWALTAPAAYTSMGVVPLGDLGEALRIQVLRGYEAQLRQGGRISPMQVKAAIRWLVDHSVTDLLSADLPRKGQTTTFLRLWQRSVPLLDADRESEHERTVIRLNVLNPRYTGGIIDLSDVHAPWLLHVTQEHILQLSASGSSTARLKSAGYAARWFAMFLRTLPGEGRQPVKVGRAGMTMYLRWLAQRARDTSDYESLAGDDPRRAVVGERLLPSLAGAGPLLVTPQRHYDLVHTLRAVLDHGRSWLAEAGAADVHLLAQEVPPFPERDDTDSELEGRSQDALPETVFLQLMAEENLALLQDGTPPRLRRTVPAGRPAPVGGPAPGVRLRRVAGRRHRAARRQCAAPPVPVPRLLDAEGPPTPQTAVAPHRRRGDHPAAGVPAPGVPAVVRRRRAATLAAAAAVPHTAAVAREQVR